MSATPALVLLALFAAAAPAGVGLLVAVGDVTPTTAVVWARGAGEGDVTVEASPPAGAPARTALIRLRSEDDLTGKARLVGLAPATRYRYRVRSAAETANGEFVTAPRPEDAAPVSFLWSGDLGGGGRCRRRDRGYPIFGTMARHRPDFFLFVGDTIYANVRCPDPDRVPGADFVATTLGQYRDKHRYQREDPAAQALFRRTGVYSIWDDHTIGPE